MKQNTDNGGCLIAIILMAFLIILFSSCYTQKKAENQVNKAKDKYEAMVAQKTRDWFPCITTELDSSGFKNSLKSADSILHEYDKMIKEESLKNKSLSEILEELKNKDSVSVCDSIYESLYRECAKANQDNISLKSKINLLRHQLSNIQPVIKKIEDSAKINILSNKIKNLEADNLKWKTMAEVQESRADKLQKRISGSVLIPWWILVLIGLGTIGYVFLKLKS